MPPPPPPPRGPCLQEGVGTLWRGTGTSLLVSVPMVGIYMPLYDILLQSVAPDAGGAAPVLAGSAARVVAVFAVAPFELLRTRLQVRRGCSWSEAACAWGLRACE